MPPSSSGVSVATLTATVTADTSDLDAKMSQAGSTVESFGSKVNSATSTTANFGAASATMAAGAAGIALGLADSVMAAGDFQATVNEIGAVSGATASELTQLSDMALQVGKDTAFSAQEGAQAISELSKAGVTVPDILNGAAMATANLAAAAGTDMPRAAEIMSNAMNMFKISGEDSARVADVLAAGANTSAASINDLALGFSQAGPSAVALGLSLEDVTAALALFADRGLSGSDAGTSLKTMLASLTPATKPAKEAFAELGLVTEESGNAFFDAQGNFVGMEQASVILYDALKDLTDQQRAQALETIFGSDASRAAELMFQAQKSAAEGTGKGYEDYRKAVEASGQATDVAEAKMAGMNGAIEALRGSIETAQIVIGTTFVGAVEFAADALSSIVNVFLNLPGPVQTAIAGVAAGAAAFLAVGSAVGFIIGPLGAFTAALVPMAAGIAAIAAPLLLVTAAIAAFAIAYKTNFLGFGDAVDSVVAKVTTFASQFGQIFDLFSNGSDAASGLTQRIEGFGKAVEFTTGLPVAGFFSGIASALDEAGNHFASIQERISELMGAGFTPLQAVVRALREEFPAFSGAIATVGTLFQNLLDTVSGVAAGLMSAFDALRNGDLSGVFQGLLAAGQAAVTGLLNHFQILGGGILQAFNAINWSAISATLYAGIQSASTGLQSWVQEQSDNFQRWFSAINWDAVATAITSGITNALGTAGSVAQTIVTKLGDLKTALMKWVTDAAAGVNWGSLWTGVTNVTAAIVLKLGDLKTALTTWVTNAASGVTWTSLWSGVTDVTASITAKLGDLKTAISTWVTNATSGLDLGSKITDGVTDITATITEGLGDLGGCLSAWVESAVPTEALAAFKQAVASAQTVVETVWNYISGIDWSGAFATLQSVAPTFDAFKQAVGTVQTVVETVVRYLQGLDWASFFSSMTGLAESVFTPVATAIGAVKTAADDALKGLTGIDWSTGFSGLALDKLNVADVTGFFSGLLADAKNALTGLTQIDWSGAFSGLSGVIDGVAGKVADLVSALGGIKDAIGSKLPGGGGPELQAGLSSNVDLSDLKVTLPADIGNSVKDDIINAINNADWSTLGTNIGTKVSDAITTAQAKAAEAKVIGTDIATNIGGGIVENLVAITGKVDVAVEGGITAGTTKAAEANAVGTAFADAVGAGILDNVAAITSAAETSTQGGITAATDTANTANTAGTAFSDAVGKGILDTIAAITSAAETAVQGGITAGTTVADTANTIGETFVTQATAGITNTQQTFIDAGKQMVQSAIDAAAQAGAGMLATGEAIGRDLGQGLINGMSAMVGAVQAQASALAAAAEQGARTRLGTRSPSKVFYAIGIDTVQGFIDAVRDRIDDVFKVLGMLGDTVGSGFAVGIRKSKPEAVSAAKDLGDSIAETVQSRLDAIFDLVGLSSSSKVKEGGKKAGKSIGDSVNTGLESKKADHRKKMTEFLDAGVDYGLNKARDAEDIGVMAANAIRDGLTSSQQTLVTTAGKIATQVVDEFGDRVQAMYDVGKNFGEGFVLGLESMADEAAAAANALGKTAEKELRKATESQSPSKAAHRVGEDVARGFAGGIASGEEMTAKAARKLWRKAWKELKDNVREFGFLGREWAVEFWQGMLDAPNMTGPLAAWITEQMVDAAKGALAKIRAEIAGITAQLDIARALVDAPSSIPEVPQPEPVDTTQRDMLQAQLDATKELTDAIEKAFTSAFSEAHKAHVAFVQGTISESEYLAKYQAAQDAYNAKNANARQVASLEAQVKAAQAAIDAETAARQKAYEQAVKDRQAAVDAETAARKQAVAQLEQAQRDAQMEMTKTVIDEANQRIAQYEKEIKKATDPKERAELKAKIELERQRIEVATKLAGAITAANTAASDFDLAKANAQIEFFSAQLSALEDVDVGGMLQGIADAITSAAEAMSQAADKIKGALHGGGKNKGEKDKNGATQDASDPALSGGGMGGGGGITQEFDKVGKAGRKMGDDINAGAGIADKAINDLVTRGVISLDTLGAAGGKAGKKMTDGVATAVASGEVHMTKQIDTSIEAATVNGEKIGHDRGRSIGVTITSGVEDGTLSRKREVTKTVDGVVKDSTDAAVPTSQQGGKKVGDQFIYFAQQNITQGQRQVASAAKGAMDKAVGDATTAAKTGGTRAGKELASWAAKGIDQGQSDVKRAGKKLMDDAGAEAKRDANRLGRNAGDDLGRGVAEGIRQRTRDVEQAARDLVNAADKAGRDKSKSKSPSLVWMAHGHDLGDGLVIGMRDRVGDAQDAARALIYTPKGLPGGNSVNSTSSVGAGGQRGGGTTVNINGPVNLPNVHNPEEFIAWVENVLRTQGVSAGRG